MKHVFTTLSLLGILFFCSGSIKAQSDPASLDVYTAAGNITVDGILNEADWNTNVPGLIFRIGGSGSGSLYAPTGVVSVKEPYRDSSTCIVKFLKKGTNLYISLNSNDKSVCRFGDSWEGDGIFMKIKNSANADLEYKLYYNLGGVNPEIHYEGPASPALGAGAGVKGTGTIVNDSTNVDGGYTAELMIDLASLGFTQTTDSVKVCINIFDPDNYSDGTQPWGQYGNFAKQYWGSEWGSEFRTLKLKSAVLPVELSSFTASSVPDGVKLSWATASEKNNLGFEVERSFDKSSFVRIAFVKGNSTTTEKSQYSFVDKYSGAKAYYRLKQVDFDGSFHYSNVIEGSNTYNMKYALGQNYPNPFNPSTTIRFSLPENNFVSIKVFNVLGNEVATILNDQVDAGQHEVNFNASKLSSGVYYYTIKAGSFTETKKFILMK